MLFTIFVFVCLSGDAWQLLSASPEGVPLQHCSEVLNEASHPHFRPQTPPHLGGTWVSTRCEVRPGPKYVLRSYVFYPQHYLRDTPNDDIRRHFKKKSIFSSKDGDARRRFQRDVESSARNGRTSSSHRSVRGLSVNPEDAGHTLYSQQGTFTLQLHQFSDSYCSHPIATFTAKGQYGPMRPSWTVDGGTDMEYSLQRVTVVPHTNAALNRISSQVGAACPYYKVKKWKVGKLYKILWNPKDSDDFSKSRNMKRSHSSLPTTEHSVAYFHDEVTNTTHTVTLRTAKPTVRHSPPVPSYIELTSNDDLTSQSTTGFYGRVAPVFESSEINNDDFSKMNDSTSLAKSSVGVTTTNDQLTTLNVQTSTQIPTSTPKTIESNRSKENIKASLLDSMMHMDCTHEVDIDWHELQLVKVQSSTTDKDEDLLTNYPGKGIKRELYLGAVTRKDHRPTTYQTPLLLVSPQVAADDVTLKVVMSSEYSPPVLTPTPGPASLPPLEGAWASHTCEVLPQGLFLTRQLEFGVRGSWEIVQRHYTDHSCTRLSYSVRAGGSMALSVSVPSKKKYKKLLPIKASSKLMFVSERHINSAQLYRLFKSSTRKQLNAESADQEILHHPAIMQGSIAHLIMEYLYITPFDGHTTRQLNSPTGRCASQHPWRRGVEQRVKYGCGALGLKTPTLYKQQINIGSDEGRYVLHLGQIEEPTNSKSGTDGNRQVSASPNNITSVYDNDNFSGNYFYSHYTSVRGSSVGHEWTPALIHSWAPPLRRCESRGPPPFYPTMSRRASGSSRVGVGSLTSMSLLLVTVMFV